MSGSSLPALWTFLWENEQTDLPDIITDTACVCESEAGVCSPGENAAELVSSRIWTLKVWKPELQANDGLVSDGFLVLPEMSLKRG